MHAIGIRSKNTGTCPEQYRASELMGSDVLGRAGASLFFTIYLLTVSLAGGTWHHVVHSTAQLRARLRQQQRPTGTTTRRHQRHQFPDPAGLLNFLPPISAITTFTISRHGSRTTAWSSVTTPTRTCLRSPAPALGRRAEFPEMHSLGHAGAADHHRSGIPRHGAVPA